MSTVRYEILLPLRYNDGTPVEQEKFIITFNSLVFLMMELFFLKEKFGDTTGTFNPI